MNRGSDHRTQIMMAQVGPLTRLATALCGNCVQAEDLVATAIERAIPRAHIDSLPAYLRRSVINLYLNHRRAESRREAHIRSLAITNSNALPAAADAQSRIDLERALATLTPLERAIVVLRYFDQYTAEETALLVARPAGTVRRLTHQALAKLRNSPELGEETDGHAHRKENLQ